MFSLWDFEDKNNKCIPLYNKVELRKNTAFRMLNKSEHVIVCETLVFRDVCDSALCVRLMEP